MSLQLHRPDGKGGLEQRTAQPEDWRTQLQSPRWGSALRSGKLPRMANPEMNPTSTVALDPVLAGPRRAHLRPPDGRLRDGLLEVGRLGTADSLAYTLRSWFLAS